MSKAPYRHSDGSDCYTKNCSRGHYTSVDAALASANINNFIEAKINETKLSDGELESFFANKPKYGPGYVSLDTLEFNGEVMDAEDLRAKTGIDYFELNEIMHRSQAGTIYHPTEEMKTLRFKTALFNHKLYETAKEIAGKKFGRFTTRKAKDAYYAAKVEEAQKIAQNVKSYANRSMLEEKLTPEHLSPVQRGDYYEVEAGGIRLYDDGYIPEHLHKEESKQITQNIMNAYKKYQETGEFNLNPWNGIFGRG